MSRKTVVSIIQEMTLPGASTTEAWRVSGAQTEQFLVTDNGGEPFQVDDETETPEDLLVRVA